MGIKLFDLVDTIINYNRYGNAFFTPWCVVHFFSGFNIYGAVKILSKNFKFMKMPDRDLKAFVLFLHTIYEIKDLKHYFRGTKPKNYLDDDNSFANSIGDSIACMIGYEFYPLIKKSMSYERKLLIFIGIQVTIMQLFTKFRVNKKGKYIID